MTLHDVKSAIALCKRTGVKPPITLVRYQRVLELLTQWQRKAKLAQTKVRIYRRKAKHYEKRNGN